MNTKQKVFYWLGIIIDLQRFRSKLMNGVKLRKNWVEQGHTRITVNTIVRHEKRCGCADTVRGSFDGLRKYQA